MTRKTISSRARSFREELANSLTHGVGLILSTVALVLLVVSASLRGQTMQIVTFSVFGATLVILYMASTLYHTFRHPRLKRFFRFVDHAAIYLLIAGTYTPFALLNMHGSVGWTLFGVIWGLAILGILLKTLHMERLPFLNPLIYIGMGWIALFAIKPAVETISPGGLAWLAAGGLVYTLGVVFYSVDRIPYNHAIWHGFVMGGSACHFFAVFYYASSVALA